jgi:hypothetical protein
VVAGLLGRPTVLRALFVVWGVGHLVFGVAGAIFPPDPLVVNNTLFGNQQGLGLFAGLDGDIRGKSRRARRSLTPECRTALGSGLADGAARTRSLVAGR